MSSLTRSECFFIHYAYTPTRRFTRLKRRFLKKKQFVLKHHSEVFLLLKGLNEGKEQKGDSSGLVYAH